MILVCLKILSALDHLILQSNGIFLTDQCKKSTILGTYHGFTFRIIKTSKYFD